MTAFVAMGAGGPSGFGVGLFLTVLGAIAGAVALTRMNWRGTFAAIPAALALAVLPFTLAALWLLVSAVMCGAAREYWRLEDMRKGQDKARHAKAAVGVIEWVRNFNDRRALTSGTLRQQDRYPIGTDNRGAVAWLPLGLQGGRHSLVIGATGSGKTTTMLTAAAAHVRAGCGLVAIDPKGDPGLVEQVRQLAGDAGREFQCFSLTGESSQWNPLSHGTPSELADKVIAAEDWSETHYKRLYQRYLLTTFTAIAARDDTPDIAMVTELLHPERLALYAREIHDDEAGGQVDRYLTDLTDQERRDLAGLRNRVALIVESEHGDLLRSNDRTKAIDLLTAISGRAVVIFSLNTSRYPETAKLLGAAIFQDLKNVVGSLEADRRHQRPSLLLVDEFSAFGQDHVLGLFQRARSAGLSLMLATQELADLSRIDPAFQDQILGNVETIIAHRQNVPASAELVAELAGTRETWVHTFQTDGAWRQGTDTLKGGNKHRGHEFNIPPDTIKQLDVGQAVVITKGPHAVGQVRIRLERQVQERGIHSTFLTMQRRPHRSRFHC